ncbi:MAG: hypothetical protein K2Q34_08130 [Alphaproteobacteria bacterium]|nr:hypothetical protein [Alphaproteobacteria bacterium]
MKFFIKAALGVFLWITHGWSVDSALFETLTLTESSTYSVLVKNVGQGSCTIVRNHENGHHLVVDAGSSSGAPAGLEGRLSEEFGFSEANSDIPFMDNSITIIVSHSDQDHIDLFETVFGLNQSLLNKAGQIVLGDHFDNYFRLSEQKKQTEAQKPVQETRDFIRDFVMRVPNYHAKLLSLSHEDVGRADLRTLLDMREVAVPLGWKKGFLPKASIERLFFREDQPGEIEILGANSGAESSKEKDTNANSAVVRLSINGKNILIMGDATGHTTGRILESVADPSILKADLLIASHHGADNEDANHITWAAVTSPKHVAISHGFNIGYKHPTLTAVANFVTSGVREKKEMLHNLSVAFNPRMIKFKKTDKKEKHIQDWIAEGSHILKLNPVVSDFLPVGVDEGNPGWFLFSTDRSIYGTGTSGDLTYVFSRDGSLVDFKRER